MDFGWMPYFLVQLTCSIRSLDLSSVETLFVSGYSVHKRIVGNTLVSAGIIMRCLGVEKV